MGGTMPRARRHPAATDGATGRQPLPSLACNVRSLRDRILVENKPERTSSFTPPLTTGDSFTCSQQPTAYAVNYLMRVVESVWAEEEEEVVGGGVGVKTEED